MSRRRRSKPLPPARRGPPDPAAPPSLYELDTFSLRDLHRWKRASAQLDELHRELYFGLEPQRVAIREELLQCLRASASAPVEIDGWIRLVDCQYCLDPLSARGSTARYGGRFNIDREVGDDAFGSFPALYIARDLETAIREYFDIENTRVPAGLSREELALKQPGSFLASDVHGRLTVAFDVSNVASLRPFAALIGPFKVPPRVQQIARELGLRPAGLVRIAERLQRTLTARNWRAWPVQLDVPANSQVFGRLLCDAGFEAVT